MLFGKTRSNAMSFNKREEIKLKINDDERIVLGSSLNVAKYEIML